MYHLPDTYTARLEPQYFDDVLTDANDWQADVYRLAAKLARESGITHLVDIGCGRGGKLIPYTPEFSIKGIDYGANIEACQEAFFDAIWLDIDLNQSIVGSEQFVESVVICADVIEHLPSPEALIETLRNASETAAYVLISTPDRRRLYGQEQSGPPSNPAHVREWTNAEFTDWLKAEGLPVVWSGWTVSFDRQRDNRNTILVILSKSHVPAPLPPEYEVSSAIVKWTRPKRQRTSGDTIRVWMTPTPSEASRDSTNAIHNIVTRMADLLPDYGVELVEHPDNADLVAAHAGQGSAAPVDVAHYHGLYPTAQGMDGVYFQINQQVIRNLRTAKAITAPSNWIADVLRRDMHVNPHIIGWGVDTEEWTPGDKPHVYALWNKGRVDAVSDPTPMLELAARAHNALFLTTFGDGTPNVRTIGKQPYETMKGYVRNAGVYLSTNVETFGIGVLEAMASGVPILGFRQGAIGEYLTHGVNAFLAEPGDMDGLYEGLHYCLKYRKTLGDNARELAKQFGWDKVAQSFANIYRSVLEPHQGTKVSVVIPCHNYEQYVGGAIESALNQETKFQPHEVIVVCDRCSDGSEAVARSYADCRVQVLVVDNGNLSATRNDGIAHATGEYIVMLDADDHIGSPHFLQTLADALDADRTLGVAFTGITVMDGEGKLGHKNAWPSGYNFDLQARRMNQIPSCSMFRKEAWRRAGGFRPYFVYCQDAEFWTTVGALGYGAKHVVDDGWFHYRLHSNSQSRVHRTGEIPEPNWTEWHPWTEDGQRPFASDGKPPQGSWPVRFYNQPDVSVIVPVGRGHEETVRDTLHSIEGQTHRLWECIVVNDTGKPLNLNDGFPWAKVVDTEGQTGAGAARNVGIQQSHAPFIAFVDADDLLKPRFLELALKAYQQHGRYAYADWYTQEQQTNFQAHQTPEYSFQALFEKPSIHPITTLIPRQWVEAVGGFDETLDAFEDVDFFMKLFTQGFCGVRIPEPLMIYNLDKGSRRKVGEGRIAEYRALMVKRYRAYMEGDNVCNCVEPPKGKNPVPPTEENVEEYREAFGEMVKVQLTGEDAPLGQIMFRGPATRTPYGRRARGDIFYVWQKDVEHGSDLFTVLENFVTEPAATVVPPAPESVIEFKVGVDPAIPDDSMVIVQPDGSGAVVVTKIGTSDEPSPKTDASPVMEAPAPEPEYVVVENAKQGPDDWQGDYVTDNQPKQETPVTQPPKPKSKSKSKSKSK